MKRSFYFLPFVLLCLFSFNQPGKNQITSKPDKDQTSSTPSYVVTGCFENGEVYVEVDYNTGSFSIIGVRVYERYYHYAYTMTDYVYDDAWYSGGHIYVTGFTVWYSYGGGSGYSYPPTSMLDNDCD